MKKVTYKENGAEPGTGDGTRYMTDDMADLPGGNLADGCIKTPMYVNVHTDHDGKRKTVQQDDEWANEEWMYGY